MKEDVETLPEKEEVIVWVELTQEQRRYYKAIYSQQVTLFPSTLLRIGGGSTPDRRHCPEVHLNLS
jgi:SNF2 family DNA or RNA helicase